MSDKARKIIGVAVIIFAVLLLVFFAYSYFFQKSSTKKDSANTTEKESVVVQNDINDEHSELTTQSTNSFSDLASVIKYDLHPQLEKRLDPVAFDAALVSYLRKQGVIEDSNGSGEAWGIYKAVDDGFVTFNLNDNSFSFMLELQIQGDGLIKCTVDDSGNVTFNMYDR